jgi:mono/diheme cytochrome c family protein
MVVARRAAIAAGWLLIGLIGGWAGPNAEAADLTLRLGDQVRIFTQRELLTSPVALDVPVPQTSVKAKAVPLLDLLKSMPIDNVDALEVQASDGFVSQIPMDLVRRSAQGGSEALIAVEDPEHPWPNLPKGTASAGPFYLVWDHPERSGVSSEQWPYQVAAIVGVELPVRRWPQIAVRATLDANSTARKGQAVFIAQCMPCHRMRGGGAADVGPDLGEPMPATSYLTEAGLRALIRDPRSVRTWPDQRMVGFDRTLLSDDDLDSIIAYLKEMATGPR